MSYDLYFSGRPLSASEFSSYFSSRPNYKVTEFQAFYQNADTGVYFVFDRTKEDRPVDPDAPRYDVSFNLNYYRPHIFGLEAEPEVRTFIETFGFSIHDPQNHGMGDGPYTPDGFLSGWNAGNEFGYSAYLGNAQVNVSGVVTYPWESYEKLWRFNFERQAVQAQFGEDLFVPKIFFVLVDGKVASAVVWGDAIPSLLPQVDIILVPRKDLAPWSLLQKKDDMCLVWFEEVARVFGQYLVHDYSLPALSLPHPISPEPIKNFVRGLRPNQAKLAGIGVDSVLDYELVERNRPAI